MYESPVLRVFTMSMDRCFDLPWQRQRPSKGCGSGVYLGENLILTGAHVVHEATFIQVQKLTAAERVIAEVRSICHDSDLALLSVTDPSFLEDLQPATLGALPELKDKVEVVGFPTGGEQVSITNGVVSRIEVSYYSHSWRNLLCVTIDAAINPGNSGGPVFNEAGEVVGIAFQKNNNAENSGQMIPPPMIQSFLDQARRGVKVVSIPSLGFARQTLESPALKRRFGVPEDENGVLITRVSFGSSICGHIEPGDVIHRINEYPISSLGTILYRGQYRTDINAVLSELAEGDEITLLRRRRGELQDVTIPLKKQKLISPRGEDIPNRYFVYGGFVFQPLTRKYLQTWKNVRSAPVRLTYAHQSMMKTEDLHEIVVIAHVLSDEVNVGYSDLCYRIISEIDGERVRDLDHLVTQLDAARGEVELKTTTDEWIILDVEAVQQRKDLLLKRYQIPVDRSEDLVKTE